MVGLAGARAVAGVGAVALAGRRIAARRAGGLEPVVVAGAGAVAGVLVDALGARITAVGPRGDMVGLADARTVAGVGAVALAGRRITACCAGDLESVVVAGAGAVAGVLVDALGARITAVGPRGDVVGLAGSRAVAGIGAVALPGRRITARCADALEAVIVAGPGAIAGVLVCTLGARVSAVGSGGHVVRQAGARTVTGVSAVALAGRRIAARGPH